MSVLPPRPDFDQLRHQARDLLRAAQAGDAAGLQRIGAVSDQLILAGAQLAVAREYGFPSWARLKVEVQRRAILDRRDARELAALLAEDPALAVEDLVRWRDHPRGAAPLNYVAMLRYDTAGRVWRDVTDTAAMVRTLLAAGAPVDGRPEDSETPLITAASYGDAEVAAVLIEAGADLETLSSPTAGGVPEADALAHAAIFGQTAVVDVLVTAGAPIRSVVMAAAAGDLAGRDLAEVSDVDRILALIMAADHQRLAVIDRLVEVGTPIDAVDPIWGRHALRLAAEGGRPASVRHLLGLGADPALRDGEGRTPLDLCRSGRASYPDNPGYAEVEAILVERG
jgi:uncharacterized protein